MTALEAEFARINRDLSMMIGMHPAQTTLEREAPLRLHSREIDSGGSPEFSSALWSWLRDSGICVDCEIDEAGVVNHYCDQRVRRPAIRSDHRKHNHRLRRALRQLSRACQDEFNVVWLLIAREMPWPNMVATINDGRYRKGQEPLTEIELTILAISGLSKTVAAY